MCGEVVQRDIDSLPAAQLPQVLREERYVEGLRVVEVRLGALLHRQVGNVAVIVVHPKHREDVAF